MGSVWLGILIYWWATMLDFAVNAACHSVHFNRSHSRLLSDQGLLEAVVIRQLHPQRSQQIPKQDQRQRSGVVHSHEIVELGLLVLWQLVAIDGRPTCGFQWTVEGSSLIADVPLAQVIEHVAHDVIDNKFLLFGLEDHRAHLDGQADT